MDQLGLGLELEICGLGLATYGLGFDDFTVGELGHGLGLATTGLDYISGRQWNPSAVT